MRVEEFRNLTKDEADTFVASVREESPDVRIEAKPQADGQWTVRIEYPEAAEAENGELEAPPAIDLSIPLPAGLGRFVGNTAGLCIAEWDFFERGGRRENEEPHFRRVGDYWREGLGKQLDGRSNKAWSAAFVSWVMRKAGAGQRFHYAEAHCHYIVKAMRDRAAGVADVAYLAERIEDYAPRVGDLLCNGRLAAKGLTYNEADPLYRADGFFYSHADVVVRAEPGAGVIETIGGNVRNSVGRKRIKVGPDGKVTDTRERWLCILRCTL
jgi:hypothetical protein